MKRYEEIAELIAADIRSGLLPPGSRLPSARTLMARHGISPATAFKAYYRLEERGLVRARERSGYFVAGGAQVGAPEPSPLLRPAVSTVVDVSELVFTVLEAARDQQLAPLGSAFPSPELFPLQRLARSLASSSRFIRPEETVASLPPGHKGLRLQIAMRYLGMGLQPSADELIITNGALEALNLCLSAVARPGDLVAIESPGFYAAAQALERLGMKAIEIPVHPRTGLDLAALADALVHHPVRACWFMTSFQNPMGTSMEIEAKRELVELLARHEVPLIEDDVYGELYFGKQPPVPAKAFDRKGLVMHCSSFSKTLAPGYRIGWVSPGRFGKTIERLKLMTTLSASVPAQVAIADYLHTGAYDKHLRKLRHALESQLTGMNATLARHFPEAISISRPQGGYFVWVQFEREFDPLALHHAAVASGISIAPGPMFSPSRQYRNCLRLNYGFPWTDAHERGLAGLAEWMRG
ncbi:PLP-dependent aminotransferase family protein [Burkholderiaceae bacterium DAT-1]|nr:PLP-dependent aminotransferase family protein [Burkholderiaceae bacterium DAT-1]